MKKVPEVIVQPPAEVYEGVREFKDISSNGCIVVLNLGLFDYPVREFRTHNGAEIYYLFTATLPLSNPHFEIKKPEEVRYLQEVFVKDDILIDLSV